MSPVPTVIRPEPKVHAAPAPLPHQPIELLLGPVNQIVVDWQLPPESDGNGGR